LKEAFEDPQLRANDMVVAVEHPIAGLIHLLGVPYKFSQTSCLVEKRPPLLGEHTREVLISILGMPEAEIETLERDGTISL